MDETLEPLPSSARSRSGSWKPIDTRCGDPRLTLNPAANLTLRHCIQRIHTREVTALDHKPYKVSNKARTSQDKGSRKVTVATSAAARFDRFAHAAAALAHVFKPWTLDTGLAVFPPGTNGNWMRLLTIEYLARMGQPGSPRSVRIWSQAEDIRVRVRRCIEVCRNLRNADHTNG